MKQKTQKNHFIAVGAVAALLVAVLVCFIVWSIFNNDNSNKNVPANSQQSGDQVVEDPIDTKPYLYVKELGIRLELTDKIKDAIYFVKEWDDSSLTAYFSTKTLAVLATECQAESGPIGAITKSRDAVYINGSKRTVDNVTTFKSGDYYYYYTSSSALCSEDARESQGYIMGELSKAFEGVKFQD